MLLGGSRVLRLWVARSGPLTLYGVQLGPAAERPAARREVDDVVASLGFPEVLPEELELTVRERKGDVWLMEHRGAAAPLLCWLGSLGVADVAIGTEDLRTLYDQYHGPNAQEDPPV